jgi:hypothetical protein
MKISFNAKLILRKDREKGLFQTTVKLDHRHHKKFQVKDNHKAHSKYKAPSSSVRVNHYFFE